jgi:hypothetical protein
MPTKKYTCSCPHCGKPFEFTPPKKQKQQAIEKSQVYTACVDYWLKTFHPGWTFGAVQGQHLKQLLNKMKTSLLEGKKLVYSEHVHVNAFQYFCHHLPDYFKDKDLQVLNSKYNEIIEQMKKGVTPQSNGFHSKNSAARFSDAANRFK